MSEANTIRIDDSLDEYVRIVVTLQKRAFEWLADSYPTTAPEDSVSEIVTGFCTYALALEDGDEANLWVREMMHLRREVEALHKAAPAQAARPGKGVRGERRTEVPHP